MIVNANIILAKKNMSLKRRYIYTKIEKLKLNS